MSPIRRGFVVSCVLLAMGLTVTACGSSKESENTGASKGGSGANASTELTGTIRMMAGHELIEKKVLGIFEKEHPNLHVETAESEGSEESATKLAAGFKTDVVETCADEIKPLELHDLLQPIDTSKVTEWDNLLPQLREGHGTSFQGHQIFVPVQAGPHGLIYNTEAFPNGVDEIKELFNPKLKGRVAMDGEAKSMIAMGAFALGYKNPYKMTEAQVTKVGEYLKDHAGQFRSFPESDASQLNLMKSGEVVLMDGGLGTATEMQEGNVPVKFAVPKEGYYAWICGMAITKDAQNLPAAYALVNFYSEMKAQIIFGNEGYVVLNEKAVQRVEPEHRETANPQSIANAVIEETSPEQQHWSEIYQEVVSG